MKLLRKILLSLFAFIICFNITTASAATADLDPTFDTDGKVTTNTPGITLDNLDNILDDDEGFAVAVDSNIRTVVAGLKAVGDSYDWVVVRYLEDGSLDPQFGGTGVVKVDVGDYNSESDHVSAVLIDSSDNIYVFGKSESVSNDDIYVAKLTSTGALDPTFGTGGIGIYDFTTYYTSKNTYNDDVYGAAFDSAGNIVMVGIVDSTVGWNSDFAVLKIDPNGNAVSSFGSGGAVIIDIATAIDAASDDSTDKAVGIAIDSQDAVYIGGPSDAAGADTAVVKLTSNGVLDMIFGGSGVVTLFVEGIFDMVNSATINDLAIDSNNNVYLGGVLNTTRDTLPDGTPILTLTYDDDFAVVKLNAGGELDTSFGSGYGMTSIDIGKMFKNDVLLSLFVEQSGKIVVGG